MSDDQGNIFDGGDNYDAGASRHARDESLKRVHRNADPEWLEAAYEAVCEAARTHPEGFIVDEVWACISPDVEYPHEARAMGPVMLRAKRSGVIVPTGNFRPSAKVSSHAVPRRIWRAA